MSSFRAALPQLSGSDSSAIHGDDELVDNTDEDLQILAGGHVETQSSVSSTPGRRREWKKKNKAANITQPLTFSVNVPGTQSSQSITLPELTTPVITIDSSTSSKASPIQITPE
jgi:hypothetical protein